MEVIKILLIEPSDSIGEIITKSLQRAFKADVVLFSNSTDAVEAIREGQHYNLIIARNESTPVDDNEEVDAIAVNLLNVIYDHNLQTPLIVIGEFEHSFKKYALVSEKLRIEEINRLVLKALGLKKEDFELLKFPDYIPFSVKHFFLMNQTPCDIYIRLAKKSGDEFVKRLKTGECFEKEDLKKYQDFGVSDFYIPKENYEEFMNALFVQTMSNLQKGRDIEEYVEVMGDSFVLSTDLMRTLGITPVCVAMVNKTLMIMKQQIQKTDKLGMLLKKLMDDQMSYAFRHSYLICALSHVLLPKMDWGSGDQLESILEKICMVSYFHDIYLEDEKFMHISSHEELMSLSLPSREFDAVTNHANRAAVLIQSYPKLPQGIDMIIKQHHGVSNGVGFPEFLTASISPLAIFFMVVEDFANNVLLVPDGADNLPLLMKEALRPLKDKYTLPSYRKIVTELEVLITPKK
jgi:HD-GYP domain-containing protein (c-di-GMP phosphodiesterase class II)